MYRIKNRKKTLFKNKNFFLEIPLNYICNIFESEKKEQL